MTMTIGENIAKLRRRAGLEQQQLARLAKISPSHLSLIETNKRDPSIRVLARLSNLLGYRVSVRWVKE